MLVVEQNVQVVEQNVLVVVQNAQIVEQNVLVVEQNVHDGGGGVKAAAVEVLKRWRWRCKKLLLWSKMC